jgi:hypothetical protein
MTFSTNPGPTRSARSFSNAPWRCSRAAVALTASAIGRGAVAKA